VNAEYIKAANKLLYGITDKRLREPEIWNDILSYAEYVAKIIRYMNGTYLKEKFYAIPLEELSKVNRENAKPSLPFYKKPSTIEQK